MRSDYSFLYLVMLCVPLIKPTPVSSQPTEGWGWGHVHTHINYANLWDEMRNDQYGGFNHSLVWPGGWWDTGSSDPVERRTFANYKGYIIGAKNVRDPQYPDVVWPYMVAQRDGRNDGEQGEQHPTSPPDVVTPNADTQLLYHGRLVRLTYRQKQAEVYTNGELNSYIWHRVSEATNPYRVGDEADAPYQNDAFDPTIPADLIFENYTWSRMGVSTNRTVYIYVDRRNDDYMIWHSRIINDGIWGRLGIDTHACCGGTIDTVQAVMQSFMFQWDRSSAGASRTNSSGELRNDSIWRYYGADYDGARTEDMRLVYVIDGDQSQSQYNPAHGKQNDIGDPDPLTGHLLSAKTGGWLILHYDRSSTDKRDDPAQPTTLGWTNYTNLLSTSVEGHEAKYNQMLLGYQKGGGYYAGSIQDTPGRGPHPEAAAGASWIKASNDPATSGQYWSGKVLGVDIDVTDVEQQAGFGPDSLAPFDTLNAVFVLGLKGLEERHAMEVGKQWLAGDITDGEKDSLVHSTIDSIFMTMRQAKSVYESVEFDDGNSSLRFASTRDELEQALWAAMDQDKLSLSPPAPASFSVDIGLGGAHLSWTLNTTTGSEIAGWRLYRAVNSYKPDSAWTMIAELPSSQLAYVDSDLLIGYSYYYYLTTFDAEGRESTMHTRTYEPLVPQSVGVNSTVNPTRFALSQNVPNPFNPTTTIPFNLSEAGEVRLTIHSVTGQIVRTLADAQMGAGGHMVIWDGTDDAGRAVASGVYLYRLSTGERTLVRRLVVVR
jgi:hypothetical protein